LSAERLESAAGRDEYSLVLETICGVSDDSQPVERYDGTLGVTTAFVASHQAAVCQVQWNSNLASIYTNPGDVSGERWGSGTMISDDLFLTCGHLFDQTGGGWERPRQNGTTNIISPFEIARNMKLNFNFQVDPSGTPRAEQSFAIVELLEYREGGLDMAICRIAGNPGATFGRTRISTTDAVVPETICIIGHPAGKRKRIEAGPTTSVTGNLIRYGDIDTLGGNSGSPIFRSSDGRLVGIHTNGGCTAASPADGGTNFGQRITAVIAASPILQNLIASAGEGATGGSFKSLADSAGFSNFHGVGSKIREDRLKPLLDSPTGTLKFRDDVKMTGLDKPPGADVKAGFDFPTIIGGRPSFSSPGSAAGSARPFVLATPHHSDLWNRTIREADNRAELESALAQLEQLISSGEAELTRLGLQYRHLVAEFVAAGGRVGGG
jgi:V8-like Glu-specific endopeptidase